MSEDPLGFDAGDNNISRYSANDPINYVDRNGLFSIGHAWNKLTDAVGDAFEDVGDFFSDQWDNGNIQKGLLAAGTLASGGMLGFGLAAGSLMGTQILAGGLGFASGLSSSYEVFSGNRIGDGSFTRYLGAAAAVTGGFFAAGVRSFGTVGRTLSGASGLISGYEIASGDAIGDGTLSSLFHVSNLGVNQGGTMFSPTSTNAQRFGVGLNLAVGTASVFSSGDRSLQQSLRALSIASGVWNTASSVVTTSTSVKATLEALKPTPVEPVRRRNSGNIRLVSGVEETSTVGMGDVKEVERRMDSEDPRIQAFWDHLAYEEIMNGPPKSRAEVYADMEAQAQADPRNAAAIRAMLKSTMEYDRSQSEDYMYGSDQMAAAYQRDQQRSANLMQTADEYTFGTLSALQEIETGMLYAVNSKTHYGTFKEYYRARQVDDVFSSLFSGDWTMMNRTSDTTLDRMVYEQTHSDYVSYREFGYDPSRDPGNANVMYTTMLLEAAAGPVISEITASAGRIVRSATPRRTPTEMFNGFEVASATEAVASAQYSESVGAGFHNYSLRSNDTLGWSSKSTQDWLDLWGSEIVDDPRAYGMYRKGVERGLEMRLDFGPPPDKILGLYGGHEYPDGSIRMRATVFLRKHETALELRHTFRHEMRHFLDDVAKLDRNNSYFEYRGHVEEFMSLTGRAPNRQEMGVLARLVESLYPKLDVDERFRRITRY